MSTFYFGDMEDLKRSVREVTASCYCPSFLKYLCSTNPFELGEWLILSYWFQFAFLAWIWLESLECINQL